LPMRLNGPHNPQKLSSLPLARWRLLSVVFVVCNAASRRAAAGRVAGRVADTARRASTVTSR